MDEAAKRRLVGAAVLVALAVIFVPMLVEEDADDGLGEPILIPEAPEFVGGGEWEDSDPSPAADEGLLAPEEVPLPLPTPKPPQAASEPAFVGEEPPAETVERPGLREAGKGRDGDTGRTQRATPEPAPKPRELAPAGPKPVPSGVSAWVIQVASLRAPEAARTLQDELRAKGYPAFVEQADVRGQRYYRVRVGPEVERARADQLAERLARDTGADPLVQRYP